MIVHITSAHPRYDTRIFVKMCMTLASHRYAVTLIVADGLGDEVKNGVSIIDVGQNNGGRLSRMTSIVQKVLHAALKLNADLYHLHDPELLTIVFKLKREGKCVVFDSHEDLPQQIFCKPYLSPLSRLILSKFFARYEKWMCQKIDAVIGATPQITTKFKKFCKYTSNINNYPLLNDFSVVDSVCVKTDEIVYVGYISEVRGIKPLVKSLSRLNGTRLNLVGKFSDKKIETVVKSFDEYNFVNEFGFLRRDEVGCVLSRSKVGIVTFLKSPNHINSQPNKMFEYMSAGLPIVTSNFQLWREIVEGNECGICVDPENIDQLVNAIQYLIDNPIEAKRLGENGRRAIIEKYNWEQEQQKLLTLYKNLSPA